VTNLNFETKVGYVAVRWCWYIMGTFQKTKICGHCTGACSPSVDVVKDVSMWLFTIYHVSWDSMLTSSSWLESMKGIVCFLLVFVFIFN
jgi:hypothetical protein